MSDPRSFAPSFDMPRVALPADIQAFIDQAPTEMRWHLEEQAHRDPASIRRVIQKQALGPV